MSIEIQVDLTGAVKEYGMFTELGNAAVHAIVVAAKANNMTWAQVYRALGALAEQKEFSEAMDTVVREYVYDAMGYDNTQQPFYGV